LDEVDEVSLAEPISPELALVDPELARRARREFAVAPPQAVAEREVAELPARPDDHEEAVDPAPSATRRQH